MTNTGDLSGDDVVQLYVNDVVSSIVTPDRLLQGFSRVSLAPGQTKTVTFHLDFDSFRLLNLKYEWVVEPGEFKIMIGKNSREIELESSIIINEEKAK